MKNGALCLAIPALTAIIGGLGSVGCASAPLPPERLAAAEAGIRGASEVGAESVPQAALHLKMARDQVGQAMAAQHDGDTDRAVYLLARAQADADLALVLTRETSMRAEAQALSQQVASLRNAQGAPVGAQPGSQPQTP